MKRALRKLSSQHGSSLIMALLFLLLAVTICTVVLSAASGNVSRSVMEKKRQQSYFTLSSAARMIADGMERAEYTNITYTDLDTDTCGMDHSSIPDVSGVTNLSDNRTTEIIGSPAIASVLTDEIQMAADEITENGFAYTLAPYSTSFKIMSEGLEDVDVILYMTDDYAMYFELSLSETDYGTMTVGYSAACDTKVGTVSARHTYKTTKHSDPSDPLSPTVEENNFCTVTMRETVFQVSWDDPRIGRETS